MTTASESLHFDYCPIKREANPRFVSTITRNTYALVLAGGRGSRLEQFTDWRAKPAVPFGGKLRIIDFPLSNCVNSGIRRIGVVTQEILGSGLGNAVENKILGSGLAK